MKRPLLTDPNSTDSTIDFFTCAPWDMIDSLCNTQTGYWFPHEDGISDSRIIAYLRHIRLSLLNKTQRKMFIAWDTEKMQHNILEEYIERNIYTDYHAEIRHPLPLTTRTVLFLFRTMSIISRANPSCSFNFSTVNHIYSMIKGQKTVDLFMKKESVRNLDKSFYGLEVNDARYVLTNIHYLDEPMMFRLFCMLAEITIEFTFEKAIYLTKPSPTTMAADLYVYIDNDTTATSSEPKECSFFCISPVTSGDDFPKKRIDIRYLKRLGDSITIDTATTDMTRPIQIYAIENLFHTNDYAKIGYETYKIAKRIKATERLRNELREYNLIVRDKTRKAKRKNNSTATLHRG